MDHKHFLFAALVFSLLSSSPVLLILAQINTPCSPNMLSSVTGCMNFLTGGGNSPTSDCCEALKSLTGTGIDCLCLIVTASVPLNLPVNRTLAISLPRACGMPGVPVKCKASAAPLPAPGPASLGPTTFPTDTQNPEGPASFDFGPTTSPMDWPTPEGQDSSESGNRENPTALAPSASLPSSSHSPMLSLLLLAFAFKLINLF